MFGSEEPYSLTGNTITLKDESRQLLLVTSDRYPNILVTKYTVELTDWDPVRRPGVKNISLQELFKRDKTYFFVRCGGTEYQVDLKYQDNPITEVKF